MENHEAADLIDTLRRRTATRRAAAPATAAERAREVEDDAAAATMSEDEYCDYLDRRDAATAITTPPVLFNELQLCSALWGYLGTVEQHYRDHWRPVRDANNGDLLFRSRCGSYVRARKSEVGGELAFQLLSRMLIADDLSEEA